MRVEANLTDKETEALERWSEEPTAYSDGTPPRIEIPEGLPDGVYEVSGVRITGSKITFDRIKPVEIVVNPVSVEDA